MKTLTILSVAAFVLAGILIWDWRRLSKSLDRDQDRRPSWMRKK